MVNKKWVVWVVLGFTLGFVGVFALNHYQQRADSKVPESSPGPEAEVSWDTLRELDPAGSTPPKELMDLQNQKVKIPGFLIPLEDDQTDISEFLLVPSPMACIHVPAPPPNQIVHVKMASGRRAQMSYAPIWVYGRLKIGESHGPYGKVSYTMVGERTEPY